MKVLIQLTFLLIFLGTTVSTAQYGYGRNNRYATQGGRTTLPQAQAPAKEPEPKTANQIVDEGMIDISKNLGLDPFEEAVVRAALIKSVKRQMELRILQLEPKKMEEEFEKLSKVQDEEIKAGLPEEKYIAYKELQKNNGKLKKKKKKKKEKS